MNPKHFELEPLDASFGARIHGLKVAEIGDDAFSELYDAWLEYALLVFSDQFMNHEQQIAFARRFGGLEFDIAALSNVL
ncbi:MAG: TauD/TfdA dioxygenase family protein, partial [Gammaproteobacteria bacterium]